MGYVQSMQEINFQKHSEEALYSGKKRSVRETDRRAQMSLKASPFSPHNPFMHKDGLLRVGSRLVYTPLKEEAKYPILVPKGDPDVQGYIRHVHRQDRHASTKHVLCQTRQKVWILHGLQEVKKTIKSWVVCQRMRKKPCSQQMAPLPESRVSMTAPFTHCGINLMGPFMVRMKTRAKQKVWFTIFTCFQMHSVHSESVFSLDTSSVINAII